MESEIEVHDIVCVVGGCEHCKGKYGEVMKIRGGVAFIEYYEAVANHETLPLALESLRKVA